MAQTFECGDVVQLRSGGPRMTVIALFNTEEAECMWFKAPGTADETVMTRKFKFFSLKKVE